MLNTAPISKQAHNMPLQPNVAQPIIQSSTHAVSSVFATSPASRPSTQMDNMAQSALGSTSDSFAQANVSSGQQPTIQQPSRGGGGLQYTNQFKAMTSNSAPSPDQAPGLASHGGAAEEGASQSGRKTVWQASERAAFLENRTEGGSTHDFKVDQSKPQTNLINKDTTSERRPGGQLAESSPTKVPSRLADHEDRKARQRMQTSSSTSSSATPSPPLQSASDTSQPSWMELAKRKSMAWSDKTMD